MDNLNFAMAFCLQQQAQAKAGSYFYLLWTEATKLELGHIRLDSELNAAQKVERAATALCMWHTAPCGGHQNDYGHAFKRKSNQERQALVQACIPRQDWAWPISAGLQNPISPKGNEEEDKILVRLCKESHNQSTQGLTAHGDHPFLPLHMPLWGSQIAKRRTGKFKNDDTGPSGQG